MSELPTLATERLVLRPFVPADAGRVRQLAGQREVAETTLTIPHPYPEGAAEAWIGTHEERWLNGTGMILAITLERDGLIGAIGFDLTPLHSAAELGYWITPTHWNRGYCSEAARAMIAYGFESLGLNRVEARHLPRNPASGRVMEKLGMQREGVLRQSVRKWERFEDLVVYSVLREEWSKR